MRTETFQSVLQAVTRALGYDPARDLSPARAATFCGYINQRIKEGWKWDFWPELMVTEARLYRPPWLSTEAVTAGTERFYYPAGNYYQALTASTNQPPALVQADGSYVENSAYWAASSATYTGPWWQTGMAFNVGDKAQNPNDGQVYQCISAHTAGATFDATKFGVLTPFDKYVAFDQVLANGTKLTPIDEVAGAYRRNPKVFTNNPAPLPKVISDKGVQFDWRAPVTVWLNYRLRPSVFTTALFSSTTAYAAGVTIYDASGTGNCWISATATTAGDTPTSAPSKWTLVPMPAFLTSFIIRAVMSDALRDQKQTDRADDELNNAYAELQDLQDRVLAAQGQYDTASAVVYGGGPVPSFNNTVSIANVTH